MGGIRDDEVIPLHAPFEIVLRGFNRQQVLDHLESLEGRIAMIAADRDAALCQAADLSKVLEHLRHEAATATERVERLQRSSLGGAGVRIERMLQVAEDEIIELRASTERETTSLLDRTRAEADRLLQDATRRCDRLEVESEQRRSTAEAEATTRIKDYQTRSMAGLHVILTMAAQRLSSRTTEVEREVTRLTELRIDVTARLSGAHRTLVDVLGQVLQSSAVQQSEALDGEPAREQGADAESNGSHAAVSPLTTSSVAAMREDRR